MLDTTTTTEAATTTAGEATKVGGMTMESWGLLFLAIIVVGSIALALVSSR